MLASALYLRLTPSYEAIPAKVLRAPVKNNGKGAGNQLPVRVFTVRSTGIFYSDTLHYIYAHNSNALAS